MQRPQRQLTIHLRTADDDRRGILVGRFLRHRTDRVRRGLARRVTESLYAWAWGHGARFAYLQVVATNAAALPLYAGQGFRTVYTYEYQVPPAA